MLGHAGAPAFAAESLDNPQINALRRKVDIAAYPDIPDWTNDRPSRVKLSLVGGETMETEVLSARGGPDRPFTQDEILAKIDSICGPVYPKLGNIARQTIALDRTLLDCPWEQVVAEFTTAD